MSRQSLESMLAETIYQVLPVVIAWASEAAREHLMDAKLHGELWSAQWSPGHRQSFEAKFPDWARRPAQEQTLMLNVASDTFRLTVLNFSDWTAPDPYAR